MIFPGTQGGPLMHVIAAKAVAFLEALQPEFKDYQQQVVANARAMAEVLQRARLPHRLRRHRQPPVPGRPDRPRTSPARTPMRRSAAPTSRSTRTRCPTIRGRRSSPAASASARRPSTTRGFKEAEVHAAGPLDRATCSTPARRGGDRRVRAAAVAELCRRFPVLRPLSGRRTGSGRQEPHGVLSVLRVRGNQGDRLAPRGRGPAGAPPPRVPALRRALHHLRVRRAGDAAGRQERRDARAVRRGQAARRHAQGAREASRRRSRRSMPRSTTSATSCARSASAKCRRG